MSKIRQGSIECTKSELDLLLTPETQTAVLKGNWINVSKQGTLDGDSPVVFYVPGDGENYLDLANSYVYFQFSVRDAAGAEIKDTDKVAPVNYFLHSAFSLVEIFLGDTKITQSSNTYPYRAMFEVLLNENRESKETLCTTSMFYKDTTQKFDEFSQSNSGWNKRATLCKDGKKFECFGRLHADIFLQDRYLLNNVPITIKMSRSSPQFCLHAAAGDYSIKIHEAQLHLRQVTLNPDVLLGHALAMERTNAKYPIRRVEMKMFNIASGTTSVTQNIANGIMPTRVVFGLVDSDAYTGILSKSPFEFKHFNMSSVGLTLNGSSVPYSKMKLDFSNNLTMMGYNSLFTGIDNFNKGNNIIREEWSNGYTIFAFDLTSDLCSGSHLDLIEKGNLNIEIDFKLAVPNSVSCVVYMEHQKIIEITKDRKVTMDASD